VAVGGWQFTGVATALIAAMGLVAAVWLAAKQRTARTGQ
jgi:hypothetical protein